MLRDILMPGQLTRGKLLSKKNEYLKPEIHSNRVCALNETTINLFKTLNCFDFIKQNRYGIVKHMHVWDGSSDSFITFNSNNNKILVQS